MTSSSNGRAVGDIPFYDLGRIIAPRRDDLMRRVGEVLDSGMLIGGDQVAHFEEAFAAYLGAAHCVAVGNGLDALRIALECRDIGPGDEVLVPGFTFYASWLAVLQTGATPVPVDVDPGTASISADRLAAAIGPRTRAIMPVHLYGIPADMTAITEVATLHDLFVVEDVAQAHGARVDGRTTGTWGGAGAFSFYPTKNLGAYGDGGAIVTDDAALAARARSRRSYGQGGSKYDHVDTGWNSRLDPIQAALLEPGLTELDAWNDRRRAVASRYREALGERLDAHVGPADLAASVWHHFVLRAQDREELRAHLAAAGIGSDVHYPYYFGTLSPTKGFAGGDESSLPESARLAREVVSLPMGAWLTDDEVERVAETISALPSSLLARHP